MVNGKTAIRVNHAKIVTLTSGNIPIEGLILMNIILKRLMRLRASIRYLDVLKLRSIKIMI